MAGIPRRQLPSFTDESSHSFQHPPAYSLSCAPFVSGGHSPDLVGLGLAVGKGRRAEGCSERGADATGVGPRGRQRPHHRRGGQKGLFHGIHGSGQAASEAGGVNGEEHVNGTGGKCAFRGEGADDKFWNPCWRFVGCFLSFEA